MLLLLRLTLRTPLGNDGRKDGSNLVASLVPFLCASVGAYGQKNEMCDMPSLSVW